MKKPKVYKFEKFEVTGKCTRCKRDFIVEMTPIYQGKVIQLEDYNKLKEQLEKIKEILNDNHD